jgi:pimeloyl-ACP methyl ester carboxylesterase
VLAFDFSGHGASEGPSAFSAELFADNARAVLDAAGVEQADVFGFSMGGYMALLLAHLHPDRVRRLAVHGTNIEWGDARVEAMHRRLNVEAIVARRPQLAEQLATLHTDWKQLFRRMQTFVASLPDRSPAMTQRAATLNHPTLVSAVDADDLFPLDTPLGLHGLLPKSRLALIPGARHALQDVNLDLLVPLLRYHFGM